MVPLTITTTFTYGRTYPIRLFVGIMLFMVSFITSILRVNMSINILGMVHPAHHFNGSIELPTIEHDVWATIFLYISNHIRIRLIFIRYTHFPQYGPRYNWTVQEQGLLLGSYFWGYLLTQIPGGILSDLLGGRHVIGFAVGMSGIATSSIPITARLWGVWGVIAVRFLTGAFGVRHVH